jgi:glycosyltransferase involved in cell wall biosynthesis
MKRLKSLLIFIPSIENGGVEKNLQIIANFLAKKKINIVILTAFKNKNFKFSKNIKFINLNSKYSHYFQQRLFRLIICTYLFIVNINFKSFIILSFQSSIVAIILSKIFRKNVIIRLNTSPSKYISNFFLKKIYKLFYNLADLIIVNSNEFKKEFYKLFKINCKNIYNPFIPYPHKKIKLNFFKKKYLNIINIARLTEQKDHLTLLRALKILVDKKIKIKAVIIGKGDTERKIRNFIKTNNLNNNIILLGYKKDAYNYIKLCDVFVLTSLYEGLPNVLLESIYSKKYTISSNCPTGPNEILKNGKYGSLFKVKNYKELSKILENIYNNKNNHNIKNKIKLGFKSLNRFNYQNNCLKYYDVINKYI